MTAQAQIQDGRWLAKDVSLNDYQWTLSDDERQWLNNIAAKPLINSQLDDTSPDPVQAKIYQVRNEVDNGVGFYLIKNFPVDDDNETYQTYLKFLSQFGYLVNQNNLGDLISVIQDKGFTKEDILEQGVKKGDVKGQTKNRPYQTNLELDFHSDLADIASLLCLREAKSGGDNYIVSSHAIAEEVRQTEPALYEVLHQPFYYYHQNGQIPDGKSHPIDIPVFSSQGGKFASFFIHQYILASHQGLGIPLSDQQKEALELVTQLTRDNRFMVKVHLNPGEILLLNSHTTYHARDAFEDHTDEAQKRKLYRSWISIPNSRPLAEHYKMLYGNNQAGEIRGGFHLVRPEGV